MRAAGIARASFCSAEIAIEPNEKVTKSLHGQTKHVESKKPRLVTEANCFLRIFFGAAGRNRTADLRITKAHEINFYIIVFVVFIIAHSLYILRFGAKMGQ